jgi:hypothetical protein
VRSPTALRLWALAIGVALLAARASGGTAEPDAQSIMQRNFFVAKFKSLQADSHMALINAKGQKRERRSTNHIKLQPNGIDSKFLVKFSSPTDIKGTSFLQVEHSAGEDDLWIYLPALKKSRRLVASNKKDSFVGSDFSYGDILLPRVDLYRHVLLRSEAVDGHDCFVVESTPANESVRSHSGYSRKITWVRKDNFLETKVEYFDLSGRLLKTQRVAEHKLIEPETQRWLALSREMTNHQSGHKTVLRFDKVEPGAQLSEELFTTRYLERE